MVLRLDDGLAACDGGIGGCSSAMNTVGCTRGGRSGHGVATHGSSIRLPPNEPETARSGHFGICNAGHGSQRRGLQIHSSSLLWTWLGRASSDDRLLEFGT